MCVWLQTEWSKRREEEMRGKSRGEKTNTVNNQNNTDKNRPSASSLAHTWQGGYKVTLQQFQS